MNFESWRSAMPKSKPTVEFEPSERPAWADRPFVLRTGTSAVRLSYDDTLKLKETIRFALLTYGMAFARAKGKEE